MIVLRLLKAPFVEIVDMKIGIDTSHVGYHVSVAGVGARPFSEFSSSSVEY